MQNQSIELYQSLLPGLGNVTLRMRYYGLYAWLASTYAQRVGSEDPEVWRHFLRRGEALYALIAVAANDSNGVAGSEWAKRELAAAGDGDISLSAADSPSVPHLQQSFGAFGAAYGSPLFDLKILFENRKHRIPTPSPDQGEGLARAFAEAGGDAADAFCEAIMSRSVATTALASMASLTPSRIGIDSAERNCYQEILLKVQESKRHAARRDTLLLLLELAAQSGELPEVLTFRWAMYTGNLSDGTPLSLASDELRQRREEWWLYHANDLMHVCLEALLGYLLELLETDYPGGVSMESLVQHAVEDILQSVESMVQTWREFANQSLSTEIEPDHDSGGERTLAEALLRGRYGTKGSSKADYAVDALRLLTLLQHRLERHHDVVTRRFGELNPKISRTLLSEVAFLEASADDPLCDTLSELLTERVLRRHLWIAVQKLRYQNAYTFLLDVDNGRLQLRKKDGPVFTNPRVSPAITFLRDIHLLSEQGITPHGRAVITAAA
ncbi:hypothetical protein DID96_28515 [Burkholderia sp. Bp8963]|nr:hypothetical protein DID96_28515 [Burkholderia sp. Bp8963]